MILSAITLTIIGIIVGFVFSVPAAGPVAAMVISNSLHGRLRFAIRAAFGAAIVDFIYVFASMVGVTYLYKYYQPFIPYLFWGGAILVGYIACKIARLNFHLSEISGKKGGDNPEEGGFRTGFAVNLTNPGVFFGWLTTSFFILTLASTIGLDTGGLDIVIERNVTKISKYSEAPITQMHEPDFLKNELKGKNTQKEGEKIDPKSVFALSFFYAFGVGLGGYFWFSFFSRFLHRHRKKINTKYLNLLMKTISFLLTLLSFYFVYLGFKMIL